MSEASERPSELAGPGGSGIDVEGKGGRPDGGVSHRNEAVLGPFTVRDLTLLGGVLITFIGSLLPLLQRNALLNLWNAQNIFFLAIGFLVPAAAAGLFIWRRLEPRRSLRVGSLSVDQFASVAAVLSCTYYFVFTVTTFTPGAVVGLLGGIALVAATTAARVIPPFVGDFEGRAATPAHVVARDAVQPAHRPAPSDAEPTARVGAASGPSGDGRSDEPSDGERSAAWFGSGWGASAAGAGAAAGAAAGAGIAAAGSHELGRDHDGRGPEDVTAGRPAAAAHGAHPMEPAPAGESAAPAAPGRTAEPAPAGVARPAEPSPAVPGRAAEPEEAAGPSADDVAGPDSARENASRGAAGAHAPGGAREIPAAEDAEALGPETVAVPSGAAGAGSEPGSGGQRRGESTAEPSPQAGSAQDGRASAPAEAVAGHGTGRADDGREGQALDSSFEGGLYGQADGEAYGAPEPPAPATAVFPSAAGAGGGGRSAASGAGTDSIGASRPFEEPAAQYEAFWFAVSQPRTAVDPMTGEPLFVLEPGEWILALQDRGHEFVVQNTDGRVGVLRELSGIERG